MCGRFAFHLSPSDLKKIFGLENLINFPERYNAAPMQEHCIIIRNRMGLARWGLVPAWAKSDDKVMAAKMIHARSETVAEKPVFRDSWMKARRCLVPASGFYEWRQESGVNQPYFIYRADGMPMALAGLWAKCGDLLTFALLTKEANGPIEALHHRMPVMFDAQQAEDWFSADVAGAVDMVRAAHAADTVHHKVGLNVGKVANDSADLIKVVA